MKKVILPLILIIGLFLLCFVMPHFNKLANNDLQGTLKSKKSFVEQPDLYTPDVKTLKEIHDTIEGAFKEILSTENKNDLSETSFIKNFPKPGYNEEIYAHISKYLNLQFKTKESCYRDAGKCTYKRVTSYLTPEYTRSFEVLDGETYRIYSNDGYAVYLKLFPIGLGDGKEKEISKFDLYYKKFIEKFGDEQSKKEINVNIHYKTSNLKEIYGFVYIDTNANNSPNIWGADLFAYNLGQDGKLYPFYSLDRAIYSDNDYMWDSTYSYCYGSGYATNTGESCASRIQENDWKIDYQVDISGDIDSELSNCLNEKICIKLDFPEKTVYAEIFDTEYTGTYSDAKSACAKKHLTLPTLEEAKVIAKSDKPLNSALKYWTSTQATYNNHYIIPDALHPEITDYIDGGRDFGARCVYRQYK